MIVEPIAGSAGWYIPPQGYVKRLREICDKHGILLIFDEVITGFGRLGVNFGADYYGVVPDMLNFAKAVTNGVIPLGGVICRAFIYDAMMNANSPQHAIEFFSHVIIIVKEGPCEAVLSDLQLQLQHAGNDDRDMARYLVPDDHPALMAELEHRQTTTRRAPKTEATWEMILLLVWWWLLLCLWLYLMCCMT